MNQLVLFVTLLHTISIPPADQRSAVNLSFNSFKAAVISRNGTEAVKYINKTTIDYYGKVLDLVKTADSAKVEKLPIIDKLNVLTARHLFKKEELKNKDASAFFSLAISRGMVDSNNFKSQSLGEIKVAGQSAQAQMVINGQELPVYYDYYMENGQWKMDMTSLFPLARMGLRTLIEQSGKSENEFIFSSIETLTGKRPGRTVWKPLK